MPSVVKVDNSHTRAAFEGRVQPAPAQALPARRRAASVVERRQHALAAHVFHFGGPLLPRAR